MAIICLYCQSNCHKNNFVRCENCKNVYDFKCVMRLTPSVTKSMLEVVVNAKDGKGYLCHNYSASKSKVPNMYDLLVMFETGMIDH